QYRSYAFHELLVSVRLMKGDELDLPARLVLAKQGQQRPVAEALEFVRPQDQLERSPYCAVRLASARRTVEDDVLRNARRWRRVGLGRSHRLCVGGTRNGLELFLRK